VAGAVDSLDECTLFVRFDDGACRPRGAAPGPGQGLERKAILPLAQVDLQASPPNAQLTLCGTGTPSCLQIARTVPPLSSR